MSSSYEIVVVGAGPVGLMLAVCLARWGHRVKIIDDRPEPTATGRADGLQPRSLHLLKNMDLKRSLMAFHPAKFWDTMFWDPSEKGQGINRTGISPSCPSFIQARYPFSTLLHQGLIERVFIEDLLNNNTIVQRPCKITDFSVDLASKEYPVEVKLKGVHDEVEEVVRANYLFSAEGARSSIRSKLGIPLLQKDPMSHVWGVIDGVVQTDFPDIRIKSNIHSDHGSMMILPREDDMVRMYIQLASSDDHDFDPRKQASAGEVQTKAKKILQPYHIEWDEVRWYSAYPIGQRIAEKYTLDHRVFLGGDSCHTHSPKAGQGMNTAFHDALNLAWKIHLVERGFAHRSLLRTYESERRAIAEELLEFDAKYASLFSKKQSSNHTNGTGEIKSTAQLSPATASDNGELPHHKETENAFVSLFKSSQEFTTGYGIVYGPNVLTISSPQPNSLFLSSAPTSSLRAGRVMPPADVTRFIDGNPIHLEQAPPFNGAFRLFVFAGSPQDPSTDQALSNFCTAMQEENTFWSRFLWPKETLAKMDPHEKHNPHSPFFTICTVFAATRHEIDINNCCPALLARYRHNIFTDDRIDPCPVVETYNHHNNHENSHTQASSAIDHPIPSGIKTGKATTKAIAHKKMGFDPFQFLSPVPHTSQIPQSSSSPQSSTQSNQPTTINKNDHPNSINPTNESESEYKPSLETNGNAAAAPRPSRGIVVVRPDGHVGCSVELTVQGHDTVAALDTYFGAFCSAESPFS